MPIETEDRTDISGLPPTGGRAPSPKDIEAQTERRVNRTQRPQGDQPGPDEGETQQAPHEQAATQKQAQRPHVTRGVFNTDPNVAGANVNILGWGDDIGKAWHFSKHQLASWGEAKDRTIHGVYAGHDAKDKVFQELLNTATAMNPFTAIPEYAQAGDIHSLGDWFDPGKTERAQRQKAEEGGPEKVRQYEESIQQEREKEAKELPEATAQLASFAIPATKAGMVAQAAIPAFQGLVSQDPDEQNHQLMWAAGMTILAGLPMGKALETAMKAFPGGEAYVKRMEALRDARLASDAAAQDPTKAGKESIDYVEKQLGIGGLDPTEHVLRKGQKPTDPIRGEIETDPTTGSVRVLNKERHDRLNKLYKSLGVEDKEGLVQKIASGAVFEGKQAQKIKDNWRLLGLPYDLVSKMPGEEMHDPRAHLDQVDDTKDLEAAVQRLGAGMGGVEKEMESTQDRLIEHHTDLNHYLQHIHSGLLADWHDAPSAVLRALAGHSRLTERIHYDYIQSMTRALEKWGVTEEHGKQLMRAAEGDKDAYEALPPEAKSVADGWGLIRAALRQQSKATRYAENFISNWVPRLDLLPEEEKSNAWQRFMRAFQEAKPAPTGQIHVRDVPGGAAQARGVTVRGDRMDPSDARIPSEVYHVSPYADQIAESGILKAGAKGGLQGDPNDKIVSMTTSRDVAEGLQRDMRTVSTIAREVGPRPESAGRADWGKRVTDMLKEQSRAEGWEFKPEDVGQAGFELQLKDYNLGDWLTQYFTARESHFGGKNMKMNNPLFFGYSDPKFEENWAKIDPKNIGVVRVPKAKLDTGALLTNFDVGKKYGLQEIRSYGDIPLREAQEAGGGAGEALRSLGRSIRDYGGPAGRGRPTSSALFAKESRKARAIALSVDPQTQHLIQTHKYATVQDTNEGIRQGRVTIRNHLLDDKTKLNDEHANKREAQYIRQLVKDGDFKQAEHRATLYAEDYLRLKDENFFHAVARATPYQIKSIGTQKALNSLMKAEREVHMPDGRVEPNRAPVVEVKKKRDIDLYSQRGYKSIEDPKYRGFMFDNMDGWSNEVERYVHHVNTKGLHNAQVFKQALALERGLVRFIMWWPMIHGQNMAQRFGMAALMNPMELPAYIRDVGKKGAISGLPGKGGKVPFLPHEEDETLYQLRREAYRHGLMIHMPGRAWADNILNKLQDAQGDLESQHALDLVTGKSLNAGDKKGMLRSIAQFDQHINDNFWKNIHDFGVMMFHVEREAYRKAGWNETEAGLMAARRANSWMGMVAPEDTNPLVHDLGRLVAFAPNWWRTWAELLVPIYKRSGVAADMTHARYLAYQSAKTMAASLAWQKLTGNLMNLATSGHLQKDNQPGQQDRIELTSPWTNYIPLLNHIPANDPRTGAVRTIENPWSRQTYDLEQALGYQSGQPGTGPLPASVGRGEGLQDTSDGLLRFAAARLSPFANVTAAMGNLDLYNSISQHQMRAIEQGQDAMRPNLTSALAAAIYMVPGGSQFVRDMQVYQDPNSKQAKNSLFGTQVHPSVWSAILESGSDAGLRTILGGLTGVNAPYAAAQRTPGQALSDQDYQRIHQINSDYEKQMIQLSAEAASGQITPYQWLYGPNGYHEQSMKRNAAMGSIYKFAPEYVNGAEGMLATWNKLYDKNTKGDGTINYDQLAQDQAKFQSEHSSEQFRQMQLLQGQLDQKIPMLAFYHLSIDSYNSWFNQWAVQSGLDATAVHKEVSEYNELYGDRTAQQQYAREHPIIQQYQAARRSWERSEAGTAYAMFHQQNNAITARLMRSGPQAESEYIAQLQSQLEAELPGSSYVQRRRQAAGA